MLRAHGCCIRAPALLLLGVEDPWVEGEEEGEEEGTGTPGFPTFWGVGGPSWSPQILPDMDYGWKSGAQSPTPTYRWGYPERDSDELKVTL